MAAVAGEDLSPIELGIPAREELGHPSQDEVSQAEGVAADEVRLADPLEPPERFEVIGQDPAQFGGREERRDLGLKLRSIEEQGKLAYNVGDEIGEEGLHLPRPHVPKKAAFPEPGLDEISPGDQGVPVSGTDRDIDGEPVLGGDMADDAVGVGQDGVVAGQ